MSSNCAPSATRLRRRSHHAIMGATLELVSEVGYPKLTIEAIAARAGVGKQTVYRWWPSKAAILRDAVVHLCQDATGATRDIPDTGDLAADLKAVLRAAADTMSHPRYDLPARALAAAGIADATLGAELVSCILEPQLRLYVERLAAARRAGQVAEGIDLRVALELLTGPLAFRWLMGEAPLSHAYTDTLVDLALRGLAPRSA
ncbi:TetR/AcrR family transcriptional regulator [Streptomyces albireticuli]|uniref:TetR/AcrR family transcriptional regulator n=1 Tax=Streptomyces albireticuli TaxID=1940 RepID=UPI0036B272CB